MDEKEDASGISGAKERIRESVSDISGKTVALFIVFLFAATVSMTVSISAMLMGMDVGADFYQNLKFSLAYGFGSAFVGLLLSKYLVLLSLHMKPGELRKLDASNPESNGKFSLAVSTVVELSRRNGTAVPEMVVYSDGSPNAFATGASAGSALVWFSSSLEEVMDEREIAAVAAHEMGHVTSGDMVSMTLVSAVYTAFVTFLSNIVGSSVRSRFGETAAFFSMIFFNVLIGLLALPAIAYFSRRREYAADAWAGENFSATDMKSALLKLKKASEERGRLKTGEAIPVQSALWIVSSSRELFSTHPSVEKRVKALEKRFWA